jgi:hypothetical protein
MAAKRWVCLAALALVCGGCGERPEVDQLAQAGMINRPARAVRACLGRPNEARAIDGTQIWTYWIGTVRYDAWPLQPPGSPDFVRHSSCNVVVVMTQGRVSQVYYTGPAGDHLGFGERCEFPAPACVDP